MMIKKLLFGLSFTISLTVLCQSNVPPQPELESGTIESQFDYIINKSSSFKDFQLIRKTSILKVKDNTLDSLQTAQKKKQSFLDENKKIKAKLNTLNQEVSQLEGKVESLQQTKDSISFFGKHIKKSLYNSLLLTTIVILIIIALFFIFKFKNSINVTKNTKREWDVLEKEFENYRKKALKKEQEIMRELQNEINKNQS